MKTKKGMICLLVTCLMILTLSPLGFSRTSASETDGLVNVNTAAVEDLVRLPRVGQKVAERIVQYREEHGSFKTEDDLKRVKGIGDKVLEGLRPEIRLK